MLSPQQVSLFQNSGSQSFQFGKFQSLDYILTSLNVRVLVEPGINTRSIPSALDDAEKFWSNEAIRLESLIPNAEDKDTAMENYREVNKNAEVIRKEKRFWTTMTLRGLYNPTANEIKLYPEAMAQEYNGTRMDELLVSTLAHETMHAYFNRPRHKSLPYVILIEEPLAEFGMLLYLRETCSSYYDWAYKDVSNKKTCYRYGTTLMDQYINGDQSLRDYLMSYKIKLNVFDMPMISGIGNNITISLPTCQSEIINGRTIYPIWKNTFRDEPRYFWDAATRTLGLDGDWNGEIAALWYSQNNVDIIISKNVLNDVSQVYLGKNFIINPECELYDILSQFPRVIVSIDNERFHYMKK